MIFPDRPTYLKDAASYPIVPVFRNLRAEFETPLSVFLKCGGLFLLESIERGENVGRYSIIACGRKAVIQLRGRHLAIRENGILLFDRETPRPWEDIRNYFAGLKAPAYDELPPFYGGAIGYLGYETVRHFEEIPVREDDGGIPDGIWVIPEMVLIYDSVKRTLCLAAATRPGSDPRRAYETAVGMIEAAVDKIVRPLPPIGNGGEGADVVFEAGRPKQKFLDGVETIKTAIRQGEIIQAVLSQPFRAPVAVSPFKIYQSLRMINPSPYLFFLDFGDFSLIGSSPEVMVRLQNREIMTKPIAGTRRRGLTVTEDDRLARELRADPKENAEHVMLVDLARNDLGRVAKPGTVEVVDQMSIEKYSHVMHIVSTVKAELEDGRDVFDLIRAAFPAGTLSGAPKIRAMEIIAEVEGDRRGPYGGLVFNLGFNGHFDSCITIRTIVVKDGIAEVRAGAGIVADSDPEKEYQESLDKAGALFLAVRDASQGGSHGPADR